MGCSSASVVLLLHSRILLTWAAAGALGHHAANPCWAAVHHIRNSTGSSLPTAALPCSCFQAEVLWLLPWMLRVLLGHQTVLSIVQGFDCPDCRRFFEAMKSWGDGQPLPVCGHVESTAGEDMICLLLPGAVRFWNAASNDSMAAPHAGARPGQLTKAAQEEASRHRYRYRPPSTPPGFWDMGFMDSLDSRVNPDWAKEDSTQQTNSAEQQAGT